MTFCGGSFGSGGVGSSYFGSGSVLAITGAQQTAINAVEVTFSTPPRAFDPASVFDALNASNWTIRAIDPPSAIVRLAQWVERVDSLTVRVLFDGSLDRTTVYEIGLNGRVRDAMGAALSLCRTLQFLTFSPERPFSPAQQATGRFDLANPQTLSDLKASNPLGTYQINDRGDFALETGRQYLRKRVFRRAFTALGEFFHLPGYGFAEPLKGTITASLLRRMQARAQAQLLREPDVVSASVTVQALPDAPSIVVVDMKVRDTNGSADSLTIRMDLLNGQVS